MRDTGVGALALVSALAVIFVPMALEQRALRGADPLPRDAAGPAFAFAREIDKVAVLELPPGSRGPIGDQDEPIPFSSFVLTRVADGLAHYVAPLPVRPRALFFFKPLPGMKVLDRNGKELGFVANGKKARANTWFFDVRTLTLRLPADAPHPDPDDYTLIYPKAVEPERSLNLSQSGLKPAEFAARSLQLDTDTRTGLLLPAPATAAWDLALPPAATLQLDAVILPPEIAGEERSDGASLIIELEEDGDKVEVLRQALSVGDWRPVRLDLSKWAGKKARIAFRTEAEGDTTLDYVFLAEPTLYTPTTEPKKLLILFLDTARRDHFGLYGYERDTTPKLDAWSKGAFVLDNARSVAPWTLPSSRTIFSGRQPERWTEGPTLAERLARAGFATGAFVGNVYLSSNFGMADGWSQHTCSNWPIAEVQVGRVKDFLARHAGRDVAVLMHTMDTHVPYREPAAYRRLWAGDGPAKITENPLRSDILSAARREPEAVKQWVMDRYDQSLRYLDDQAMAMIEAMGPDTTVVILSDHGEEFWDHGDFEHGHSLYDELLRVPLIVYDPKLPPGRSAAPVSLLDLVPTLLDLLGFPVDGVDGTSLLPLARGESGAEAQLVARPQAVGRPLYGLERWGVLSGGRKWTTHAGNNALFDLAADPGELRNLAAQGGDPAWTRAAMAEALNTEAPLSWRVAIGRVSGAKREEILEFRHPLGFSAAWLGGDPLEGAPMTVYGPDSEGVVRLAIPPGKSSGRELYLVPAGPPEQLAGLSVSGPSGASSVPPELLVALPTGGDDAPLWSARAAERTLTLTWGYAPRSFGKTALEGMDPELEAALEAIGYQERDE